MNPLLLIGLACIIAAIVGGGLKLTGIEIPLLTSVRRQILLGGFGIALVAGVGITGLTRSRPARDGTSVQPSLSPGTPQCYGRFFQGIAQDRITSLEEGSQGSGVIRQDQPKDQPVGLELTENGHPIGALRFKFFSGGDGLFKIDGVVDARCREITQLSNADRPGSSNRSLSNWDTLRVKFGDHSYTARFGAGGDISVHFTREA